MTAVFAELDAALVAEEADDPEERGEGQPQSCSGAAAKGAAVLTHRRVVV